VHFQFFLNGDDELAMERPQGLGLFVEPGVVLLSEGDLEDELLLVLSLAVSLALIVRNSLAYNLLSVIASR
jgi:hypothetical protein